MQTQIGVCTCINTNNNNNNNNNMHKHRPSDLNTLRALGNGARVVSKPAGVRTICRSRSVNFSREQLDFLERKKNGEMPLTCPTCSGTGMVTCGTCRGTGQNQPGLAERFFGDEQHVVKSNAPDINLNYLFTEEMPCFICKGQTSVPCSECSGTGIADFANKFSGGD
jgi:RecJ-like exonuclease